MYIFINKATGPMFVDKNEQLATGILDEEGMVRLVSFKAHV